VIALDRLESALVASDSEPAGAVAFQVNNDPPKVIFTTKARYLFSSTAHRDIGMSVEPTCS